MEKYVLALSVFTLSGVLGLVAYQQKQILEEQEKETSYRLDLVTQERERVYYFKKAELKIDELIRIRKDEKGSN